MRTHVRRWGNCLAIRIPSALACDIRVEEGTPVELSVKDGQLVVVALRPSFRLEDLLPQVTDENLHAETDWGAPLGGEVW